METVKIDLDSLPPYVVNKLNSEMDLDSFPTAEKEIFASENGRHENIKFDTLPIDEPFLFQPLEASDPTFVNVLHQQLDLSSKKGKSKSKQEKLEKRRTKKIQKELENSLKVPTKKTSKKDEENS